MNPDQDTGPRDTHASLRAALDAAPGLLDALAAPVFAERDDLLLTLARIAEGSEPTGEEFALACGTGGPLAGEVDAGLKVPGWRVIAAAVPARLLAARAARRPGEAGDAALSAAGDAAREAIAHLGGASTGGDEKTAQAHRAVRACLDRIDYYARTGRVQ